MDLNLHLTQQLITLSQQLALNLAARKITFPDSTKMLCDAVKKVSGGDDAIAEELISLLCSQSEDLFREGASVGLPYATLILRVSAEFGDPFYCGRASHTLGKTLKRLGRYQDAKGAFQASLDYFGNTYPVHAGVAAGDLASALFLLGDYADAEQFSRFALHAALQTDDVHNQLEAKLTLGNTLVFTSQNEAALKVLEDGLRQARNSDKPYHEGAFLTGIADLYENVGRFDDSVAYHQAAIAISRQIEDKESELQDLLNLGNLQYRFNRYDAALQLYKQAYGLARELDHLPHQAQLMNAMASVLTRQDELEQAISMLENCLRICRQHGLKYQLLRCLSDLGNIHKLKGDYEKAREYYAESLELSRTVKDRRSLAVDLRSMTSISEVLGDSDKALEYATEGLKVADELNDAEFISKSERQLANLLRKIPARRDEVWQHYLRAVETSETVRRHVRRDQDRIDFYSSHQYRLYDDVVRWLLDNGNSLGAFEFAERFKSRLLLDLISERETGKLSDPETAQQLLERARGAGSETAIASYFTTNEETILFFIPPGGRDLEHIRLPVGLSVYLEWFERWFSLIPESVSVVSPAPSAAREALEELDTILVAPLRDFLKQYPQTKRLLLIPHRLLHSLPIHAARNPKTGRYLAEDFTVTYLPALRLLKTPGSEPTRPDQTLLAVGEPLTKMSRLPAALEEAEAVAGLFGANVLTGAEATLKAFIDQAANADIIHLACHCKFDPQEPRRSHLLLAGDEHLTAEAISSLQLKSVDLVSMAACDSGRVRPGGVDESLGLTRSWLISDVRFVLGAQWKVDDETSKLFMLDFYRRLREGVNCPDAYSAAQRLIIKRPAPSDDDPRLWAPFILTGYA